MKLTDNTILLTGGTSGIGLALVERFLARGNKVIVTGRREALLAEAKAKHPALVTMVSDSGDAGAREKLARDVVAAHPEVNVLVNNAGIQRAIDLTKPEAWADTQSEIAINLEGPIHLTALFAQHLATKKNAAILNVSSGLAFSPIARLPVYCATKAALHSYTLSARHQLAPLGIEVIEVVPPAVHSNLGGSHAFGVPTAEYADSVLAQLEEGRAELTYEMSSRVSQASRADLDAAFARMNASDWRPTGGT